MKLRHTPSRDEQQAFLDYGDRVVDGDTSTPTNDLESTFLRVQRAMRTHEATSRDMPDHLRMRAWEDIMQNTAAIPTGKAAGRPGNKTHPRSFPSVPPPRMAWSGAASIALAVLVVIAGFGAWRAFDGGMGDGGNGPAPSGGHYAQAPMTPVPMASAEVSQAGASITSCDLSGDIPIVKDLAQNASPIGGTSIYTVRHDRGLAEARSDLMIGCEGEDSAVLATDVIDVWAGPWPGTVSIATLPEGTEDPALQHTGYVDFVTGRSVSFAPWSNESAVFSGGNVDRTPWRFGPMKGDPGAVLIADLRTMESQSLSELSGGTLPENAMLVQSPPADDGSMVLGFAHPHSENVRGGELMAGTDLPGDLLVLGSSFDDVTWISLPESLSGIQSMWLSPHGTHVAVATMRTDEDGIKDSYDYAIVDLTDGALIAQSEPIPYMDNPFVAWVQDGTAIAFTAKSTVLLLSVDGGGQARTVFEAEQQLMTLNTTWNDNVVTVTMRDDHGSDADPTSTDRDVVYSVNLETGDSHEFAGMDASSSVGWITDAGALVMYDWDDEYPDSVDYRVFDPVTGERIGSIEGAPSVQPKPRVLPTMGRNSVTISEGGKVEVIALGTQHIYAFQGGPEGMEMRRIDSPEGLLSEIFLTGNVYLSPDGSMLALNGEEDEGRVHYLMALNDPDAEWLAYTPETVGSRGQNLLTFAEGIE
jgi:hypothetical protein